MSRGSQNILEMLFYSLCVAIRHVCAKRSGTAAYHGNKKGSFPSREYILVKDRDRADGFCKTFNVSVEGQIMGVVVPPLIFSSTMQYEEAVDNIDCQFIANDENVTFILTDGRTDVDLSAINIRLTTIYGTNYSAGFANGTTHVTIPIK